MNRMFRGITPVRVVGCLFFLVMGGLLIFGSRLKVTGAQFRQNGSILAVSPLSGGVLAAQAVRSGAIAPFGNADATLFDTNALTCSPAPCVLPTVRASEGGQPVNEDPITANPRNSLQLLSGGNDYNCASLQGFFASSDGGSTWNHTCMGILAGLSGFGDPVVGYDTRNTAYIMGIDATLSLTNAKIAFETSTDNGTTWSAPKAAVGAFFSNGLTDKPWLQIDTNRTSPHINTLYLSITQFDSTQSNTAISVSHSSDGGTTWTTTLVDTEQFFPAIDQFSDLAIGKDGTVYVSWMRCTANGPTGDCGGTVASMMFSKSTDGGNTWSAPVVTATANLAPDTCGAFYGCLPKTFERVSNVPAIDIDNSIGANAGHLYVVMYNYNSTAKQMRVQVTRSINGGATWSTPLRVAPTAINDEFFPWLTVNSTGWVGVTWLDRRNDSNNVKYQAFAAVSRNGGAGYGANQQLTTALSNPNNDGFGGSFMGDYTGNIWVGRTLFASWMDTSNGTNSQDTVGGFSD